MRRLRTGKQRFREFRCENVSLCTHLRQIRKLWSDYSLCLPVNCFGRSDARTQEKPHIDFVSV